MSCQVAIADKIVEHQADYLLAHGLATLSRWCDEHGLGVA